MFCGNCGTNLPDDAVFCSNCGTAVSTQRTYTPDPIVTDTAYTTVRPQKPVSKFKYFASIASAKSKVLSAITWVLFIAVIVVLALGLNKTLSETFYEIPIFEIIFSDSELDSIKDQFDEIKDKFDEIEEDYISLKDDMTSSERKQAETFIEVGEDVINDLSLVNIRRFFDAYEELSDDFEVLDEYVSEDELENAMLVYDILIIIAVLLYLFVILFTVLSAVFRLRGLSIFAMIMGGIVNFVLAGTAYTVIAVILYLTIIVLLSIINKEYKNYKRALMA